MYEVNTYLDRQFKIYELRDTQYDSFVRIAPERGGIITSFDIKGQEIFYMDGDTFYNLDKPVSGGNPILFPICGRLANGEYEYEGKKYSMGIHGIVRDYPWEVIETGTDESAYIKIRFRSSEETKLSYPFDYEIIYTYSLRESKLTIDQEYKNLSDVEMPFYIGFHPYFRVSDKAKIKYDIDVEKYYEYKDSEIKLYTGIMDMTDESESKIFFDVKSSKLSIYDDNYKSRISMEYSKEFKYVVLWSVIGSDFVCVEPWTAKPDSMNTKEDLHILKPGECYNPYLSIKLSRL